MSKWIKITLITLLSLIILAGGVFLTLYFTNEYTLLLTLKGEEKVVIEYGEKYEEQGAEAIYFGSIFLKEGVKPEVIIQGGVDESKLGTYTITYTASYEDLSESLTREVTVIDSVKPEIKLNFSPENYTLPGHKYAEEGFTATDNYDGDITDKVVREENEKGDVIRYRVTDSSGNETTVTRFVYYNDPIPPVLTLLGDKEISFTEGKKYEEPGFEANDNCDGDISEKVSVTGEVKNDTPGTYTLKYTVSDSWGNTVSDERVITVKERPKPVYVPEFSGSVSGGTYDPSVTPNGRTIYLTFDDGPGANTPELLRVLRKYNVKATFFVVNTPFIDYITQIAADGHSIGIHSTTHVFSSIYASEEAFFADIENMGNIIYAKTGIKTSLLRFPGGSSNTVSRFNPGIMTRLTKAVTEQGYQYFDWNVDSGDAGGASGSSEVFYNVISGVSSRTNSIVLQHDIKYFSIQAVEDIIIWGLNNGYTFSALYPHSPTAHHGINN